MKKEILDILKKHYESDSFGSLVESASAYITDEKTEEAWINEVVNAFGKKHKENENLVKEFGKEVATVVVDTVLDKWENPMLEKIFVVHRGKFGDPMQIDETFNFSATVCNPGASSFENLVDKQHVTIPTDIVDVFVNVSIFKILNGAFSLAELKERMKSSIDFTIFALGFNTMLAAVDTSDTDRYDDLSSSTDFSTDLKTALSTLTAYMSDYAEPVAIIGMNSKVNIIQDFDGYSEQVLADIDKGMFSGTWRGIPIVGIKLMSDKNGVSLLSLGETNYIGNHIVIAASGANHMGIQGSTMMFQDYDIKQKTYRLNAFVPVGFVSIDEKNCAIKTV